MKKDKGVIVSPDEDSVIEVNKPKKNIIAIGNGAGAVVILKRAEVKGFFDLMKELDGFYKNDAASKFGADIRLAKETVEAMDEHAELVKNKRYKELIKEFKQKQQDNPQSSAADIINTWVVEKEGVKTHVGDEFLKLETAYRKTIEEYFQEKVKFKFRSFLSTSDFREGAIASARSGYLLTYFEKE